MRLLGRQLKVASITLGRYLEVTLRLARHASSSEKSKIRLHSHHDDSCIPSMLTLPSPSIWHVCRDAAGMRSYLTARSPIKIQPRVLDVFFISVLCLPLSHTESKQLRSLAGAQVIGRAGVATYLTVCSV